MNFSTSRLKSTPQLKPAAGSAAAPRAIAAPRLLDSREHANSLLSRAGKHRQGRWRRQSSAPPLPERREREREREDTEDSLRRGVSRGSTHYYHCDHHYHYRYQSMSIVVTVTAIDDSDDSCHCNY